MWQMVKLGDIIQTGAGGTPLKSKKEFYEGGDIKWLLSGAVCERDIHGSKTYITQAGLDSSSAKMFPKNTVLIAMYGATAGQVGILRTEAATNQAVCGLYPSNDYLPEFLYYYLTNYKETLLLEVSGVAQPNLSQVKIKNIPLPVLSLAEQQRIVAKLDAAFAEIDRAIEITKAKEAEVETLKASLLTASLKDDAVMWRTVNLGDVCDFQGGSQPPKKEFVFEPQDGYIRFLQIRDFKSDKNVTFIPISKKNRLCNTDDILIGRYGASVGQILRGLEGAYNVALMKTIPNVEMISKGWLYSYLNSPLFQKPLMEVSSRSAQNGFSKDDISGFELPLPPLAEQQRIVAKLDAAFAEIDTANSSIASQRSNYIALKSAILAQELQPSEAA